ncbi:MAG: DUF4381 domain-containing protein [Mariprofundales bacterium]|nr:DUF4381 domain-containing protein [Mariprofundales bacterium]
MKGAASLAQLRDIHLPDAVSWWPPALGWWLLFGLVLLLVALFFYWRLRIQPGLRARRQLQQQLDSELSQISASYEKDSNAIAVCSQLSALMRRVALHCFSDVQAAGLQGDRWLRFLDQQALVDTSFTGTAAGALLVQGAYQAQIEDDGVAALIAQCSDWMKAALKQAAR